MKKNYLSILMCTLNGDKFLKQQLNSIKNQSFQNFKLYISDDGSNDKTLTILNKFKKKKYLKLFKGPGKGCAQNFFHLIRKRKIRSNYYAMCDQDDIWHKDKLTKAIKEIKKVENEHNGNVPILYASRCNLINHKGKFIGKTMLHLKKPTFGNSMLQNICSGNTIVFNNELRKIFLKKLKNINLNDIFHQDLFLYQLNMIFKGITVYDSTCNVDYRQHNKNLTGYSHDFFGIIKKLKRPFSNFYYEQHNRNFLILKNINRLNNLNKVEIKEFENLRSHNIFLRIKTFFNTSIKKETWLQNLILFFIVLIRKF